MKTILFIISLISLPCQALTCGLYQVENFGDRALYSLTRFQEKTPRVRQTLYTITNPDAEVVRSMVRGLCYCALGSVVPDPEFGEDQNYQLLTIEALEGLPSMNCMP